MGAIFDGTGYGSDGTVWGGELLLGDLSGFERVGLLVPARMPGGAAAIRQPWRMACSWLSEAIGLDPALPAALRDRVSADAWRQIGELARTGVASPLSTSMGRLFDAVAALSGIRAEVTYEGQAAVELEASCEPGERGAYPFPLVDEDGGPLVMDARPVVAEIARELSEGVGVALVAARFHNAVAEVTAQACVQAAERGGTGDGGALRRGLPEPAAARAQLGPARRRRTAGSPAGAAAAQRRGHRHGQLAVVAARVASEERHD